MDGDVIRRIGECGDYIGHIHTAGNPGRGELDNNQEINYPPIMQALLDIGYKGFVGQEFIPTRDPVEGLAEAVELCDIEFFSVPQGITVEFSNLSPWQASSLLTSSAG